MPAETDQIVRVSLGTRSYDIALTTRGLADVADWADRSLTAAGWPGSRTALVVTDEHVDPLYGEPLRAGLTAAGWRVSSAVVPAGEHSKSQEQSARLYDALVACQADRRTAVVALGGGVVGDLAGFVAATYNRGLPFLQIPTTLLAQVDSSVGGKVGINHPRGKNLIGAFHQPAGVLIDTATLQTLPVRDYRSGLAEVVKYGVILDAAFFEFLACEIPALERRDPSVLREVVAKCCRLKGDVVEQDEYERTGLRAVLNYGHTFGHAFEALAGYGELMHGEAVAIGMTAAARLAERLGRIGPDLVVRQRELLTALGLPIRLSGAPLATADLLAAMRLDKKNVNGQLRFVLPTRLGHVETVAGVPETDVAQVLREIGAA